MNKIENNFCFNSQMELTKQLEIRDSPCKSLPKYNITKMYCRYKLGCHINLQILCDHIKHDNEIVSCVNNQKRLNRFLEIKFTDKSRIRIFKTGGCCIINYITEQRLLIDNLIQRIIQIHFVDNNVVSDIDNLEIINEKLTYALIRFEINNHPDLQNKFVNLGLTKLFVDGNVCFRGTLDTNKFHIVLKNEEIYINCQIKNFETIDMSIDLITNIDH
jgi:hypothetical protein